MIHQETTVFQEKNKLKSIKSDDVTDYIKDEEKLEILYRSSYIDRKNNLKTAKLFDDMWNSFGNEEVEEAVKLLFHRFKVNNIPLDLIKDKTVLEIGCGSGRYSFALKMMGAKKVIGVDIGKGKKFMCEGVEYIKGNALNLPFEDNTFDFVFSNGVFHHTGHTYKCISEMERVMKPGAYAYLFILGKCKLHDMLEQFRRAFKLAKSEDFRKVLELYAFPKGKQFFLTDILFVPIRTYVSRKEHEIKLKNIGFSELRFLDRGMDYDFPEQVYNNKELEEYLGKNGDGELRYLIKK